MVIEVLRNAFKDFSDPDLSLWKQNTRFSFYKQDKSWLGLAMRSYATILFLVFAFGLSLYLLSFSVSVVIQSYEEVFKKQDIILYSRLLEVIEGNI